MRGLDKDHDWASFSDANPDLFENYRDSLGRYYTEEVLSSEFARHEYALPNRAVPNLAAEAQPPS